MYGSSLMLVTRMLRDSRIAAREAAAMPFPREETTPPVTKTYLVIDPRRVGMEEFTYILRPAQMSFHRDSDFFGDTMADEQLDTMRGFSAAILSDVLDGLGLMRQAMRPF